jgi:hypothetical protein
MRPVIKLADGTWLVGDHRSGDDSTNSTMFLDSEFALATVRWLKLDIARVATRGFWVEKPDLSKVDEIGFTDLMRGSGHGWGGFVGLATEFVKGFHYLLWLPALLYEPNELKGRIVKGGQPLQITGPSGTAWVEVNIFPADAAEASKLADTSVQTETDGSFFVDYEGRGVPPGKYKLAVFQRNLGPGSDQLNGKFSQQSTTVTVDADSSKVGSTVDLGTIDLDKGGK